MPRSTFLCALLGFGLISAHAHAEGSGDAWDGGYKQVATRRSGFMLGITTGLAIGNADGYPNALAKLDNPDYERNTHLGFGGANRLWLGGAFTDWFVFGFGLLGVSMTHEHAKAAGGAYIFHVEGYPLFDRGGAFRDLSLFGDFGAGGMKISGGNRDTADGGLMSVIGLGAAYDPLHFWHFTLGPSVEYLHLWSQSMSAHSALIEARFTFVGGP